jgi:DNA-binding NarL/FixJ family response regulator
MIRLGIIAAVRLLRDGLTSNLAQAGDLEVVLAAADWRAAAPLAQDLEPDVVLLDVPLAEGRAAVHAFAAAAPSARLVALFVTEEEREIVCWAEAGVAGYVTRDNSLPELVDVIRCVARDEMPCSPRVAATLLRHVRRLAADRPLTPRLTARELQVVRLIERGLSNKEIGSQLRIEVATVKNHVHNILEKLEVRSRVEAVARVRSGAPPERARVG